LATAGQRTLARVDRSELGGAAGDPLLAVVGREPLAILQLELARHTLQGRAVRGDALDQLSRQQKHPACAHATAALGTRTMMSQPAARDGGVRVGARAEPWTHVGWSHRRSTQGRI
jgi:hypothetical protein